MNYVSTRLITASILLAAALAGCDNKAPAPTPKTTGAPSTAPAPATTPRASANSLPATLFLTSAPADAKPVEDAKKAAVKKGDTVTIRGRIGGSEDPFVENRAVFTIMGPGVPACSDNPEDKCKTPWDYCCETPETIAAHQATVQVVDAAGQPLKVSMKGQNGLKELSDCTIVGKVAQAEGPILVINATSIFVASK